MLGRAWTGNDHERLVRTSGLLFTKARTFSDVEEDYLNSIKTLGQKADKK